MKIIASADDAEAGKTCEGVSRQMFDSYNTIDTEDIRLAANRFQGYLANVDQVAKS
jgi:hypothetical protein